MLLARNWIETAIRGYLAGEDFIMVDPPGLQRSPGNEMHLHAFSTLAIGEDGESQTLYLHTSPEFSMKKLLAAGEQRIASLGHVWRNRERTATHHPEFTMLEWYRAGEPYETLMDDCVALMRVAAEAAGTKAFSFRGRSTDPFAEPEKVTLAEAFDRFARIVGVAPMESLLGWRMSLAKDLLRRGTGRIEEIAERVGYGSASAFSTAFARHVGVPPKRFAMAAG